MATLSDSEIDQALGGLPGWSREGEAIAKSFERPSFGAAIAFVTAVGFVAEAANHHPDIDVRWRTVRLALTTHDQGGLTARDVDLAQTIETIV